MDGGGRFLEPLAVGFPGGAAGRSTGFGFAGGRPFWLRLSPWLVSPAAAMGWRRRSSVAVPLARRLPRLTGTVLTLVFFGGVGMYGLSVGGQFAAFRQAYGAPRDVVASLLGFGLKKVTISGLAELTAPEVLKLAGIAPGVSLPFLSASDARQKLESDPLVATAGVRKLYPSELRIKLVERQPFALWQKDGELSVVAVDGTVIEKLRDARFAALPLVVGDMANDRASRYVALLDAAGPLRGRIQAGMLVSGRRWTLKMRNGVEVKLPEEHAVDAVTRLVRLERDQQLLEKDVLAIDLRMPDRVVVRLSEEAAAARAEIVKKRPVRGAKGVET